MKRTKINNQSNRRTTAKELEKLSRMPTEALTDFTGLVAELEEVAALFNFRARSKNDQTTTLKEIALRAAQAKYKSVYRSSGNFYNKHARSDANEVIQLLKFAGRSDTEISRTSAALRHLVVINSRKGLRDFEQGAYGLKDIVEIYRGFKAAGTNIARGSYLQVHIGEIAQRRTVAFLRFHIASRDVASVVPEQDLRDTFSAIGHPIKQNSQLDNLLAMAREHDNRRMPDVATPVRLAPT
ncbi:MAG: hypothetical protein AB7H77_10305 [Bdellovibrionales bacterium]